VRIVDAIRRAIATHRAGREYEKIEAAIRTEARLASEAEFHRTMSDWYTKQLDAIDPHADWWGFAQTKQKEQDHIIDHRIYSQRRAEAQKIIAARTAQRWVRMTSGNRPDQGVAG
jgi:hypothetical protein